MLGKLLRFIKKNFILSMSDRDKAEFTISINRINTARAKITSTIFIVMEFMMLIIHYITNKENLFRTPYIYYGSMYILMLTVMIAFLIIYTRLGTDVPKNISRIRRTGVFFICFILAWCARISLLDQLSNGQVIVYVVAVIAIAITPFFEPVVLFLVYFTIHSLFLISMPYFQESSRLIFANSINSSTFVIMSWAISFMRYKKQAEDFINKKIILEKNKELRMINMQLQEANQKLEKMSRTDGLTGIINRLYFEVKIKDEWDRCKRDSAPLSLIMVDIDFFKGYNDKYGHQAGDSCIKLIANVLTLYVKHPSDIVARYGGDEFMVLLPNTDKEDAINLAKQMRIAVEDKSIQHSYSSVSEHVTISLGINTTIPSDQSSIDEFIRNTDKALYMAKERRNCSVFFIQQEHPGIAKTIT